MNPWRKVLLFLVVAGFASSTWYFLQKRTITEFPDFGSSFIQEQKLTASDGAAIDSFGISVSLSADGTRMAVAAHLNDPGGVYNQGAVYIFLRVGTTWSFEQKLTASDGAASDLFGYSISMSGDGSRVGIGSYQDDVAGAIDQGSAYIFSRSGTTWTEEQHLTASDGLAGDNFGPSISLSGDGFRVAVGAHADDVGANGNQGSTYIFSRSGTTWTEEQHLTASDGAPADQFGLSAALSDDGSRVVVGAYADNVGANADQGSAYIFSRSGTTWTQEQQITVSDGAANDRFGWYVYMSGDDSRVAVGAYSDDVGANGDQGSAYIFSRSGTTWTQEQQLNASDGAASDQFGYRLELSDDGTRVAVGANLDNINAVIDQGSAYIFSRSGTTWTQEQQLTASDGAASDNLGISISLSGDGFRVAMGAHFDNIDANADQGSAYIFNLVAAAGARRHPEFEFTPTPSATPTPSVEVEPQSSQEVQPPETPSPSVTISPIPSGLPEGTIISTPSDPDIYVINASGYKRLFINPAIFAMYGHLRWDSIVTVDASVRDSYTTSLLFRDCETNAEPVYVLEPTAEDTGILHWLNISADEALSSDPQFFSKVFCINTTELNFYGRGAPYTSLGQMHWYTR